MTDKYLRLRELEKLATKGPWEWDVPEGEIHAVGDIATKDGEPWHVLPSQIVNGELVEQKDALFICEARNQVAALREGLEKIERELFATIAHGDADHKKWLHQELEKFLTPLRTALSLADEIRGKP